MYFGLLWAAMSALLAQKLCIFVILEPFENSFIVMLYDLPAEIEAIFKKTEKQTNMEVELVI